MKNKSQKTLDRLIKNSTDNKANCKTCKTFYEIEVDGELCKYCPYTEYGSVKANTGYWNLCEGCYCDEAYENYLDIALDTANVN